MSQNKHTPEPWSIFGKDNHIMGNQFEDAMERGIEHSQWTHNCTPEDARRITACVNACAGIETELLEIIEDNDKTLAGVIANVEKQRDELLAALNFARQGYQASYENGEPDDVEWAEMYLRSIDVAIARAKGEQ